MKKSWIAVAVLALVLLGAAACSAGQQGAATRHRYSGHSLGDPGRCEPLPRSQANLVRAADESHWRVSLARKQRRWLGQAQELPHPLAVAVEHDRKRQDRDRQLGLA